MATNPAGLEVLNGMPINHALIIIGIAALIFLGLTIYFYKKSKSD